MASDAFLAVCWEWSCQRLRVGPSDNGNLPFLGSLSDVSWGFHRSGDREPQDTQSKGEFRPDGALLGGGGWPQSQAYVGGLQGAGRELPPSAVTPPFRMGFPFSSRTKPFWSVLCTRYSFFSLS